MVAKLSVEKSEKKLSEMSIKELQELSEKHYPERKKEIMLKFYCVFIVSFVSFVECGYSQQVPYI